MWDFHAVLLHDLFSHVHIQRREMHIARKFHTTFSLRAFETAISNMTFSPREYYLSQFKTHPMDGSYNSNISQEICEEYLKYNYFSRNVDIDVLIKFYYV